MPQTTAIDGTGPVLVRVVSDGTAGMRLQALALAESLQRARPDWKCDEFTITPHPLTRAMPRLAACCHRAASRAARKRAAAGRGSDRAG